MVDQLKNYTGWFRKDWNGWSSTGIGVWGALERKVG
jgi:hypothetical protein